MNWWAATTMLGIVTQKSPNDSSTISFIDVLPPRNVVEKAILLVSRRLDYYSQFSQLKNPDFRIGLEINETADYLDSVALSLQGIASADYSRFGRCFWEMPYLLPGWNFQQSTVSETIYYGGREHILLWEDGNGELMRSSQARIQGLSGLNNYGIAISQMRLLPVTLFRGNLFDNNVAVIIPKDIQHLPAIWAFCSSDEFCSSIRKLDQKTNVTNGTFEKIPFDLSHWQVVAEEKYPNGLPEPHSTDPTQWLFKGDIVSSTDPLQATVARMLGYRWPEQPKDEDAIDALADKDGIVCIPAVRGERPAAERLLDILRTAYGSQWSDGILHKLLMDAGCRPTASLDDWLRDNFFEQHCKRFHHRPFIWHIWDGRKDGLSCLVNYHKHTHQRLETLTYAYLQDWITAQTAAARDGKPWGDLRLAAAQELQNKLKLILDGEPPYDIFVRWKPIHEQPIGWNPDLNDGVRVNIRPFIMANVLRKPPNIKWTKDRGKEPERDPEQFPWFWMNGAFTGDRINDVHLTNAQKRAAPAKAGHRSGGS